MVVFWPVPGDPGGDGGGGDGGSSGGGGAPNPGGGGGDGATVCGRHTTHKIVTPIHI